MLDLESFKGLWDALTGGGTLLLAVVTVIVVLQTWCERRDNDRRHKDSLRPICILTPHDRIDPQHWRDTLATVSKESAARQGFGIIELKCSLRNIGPGPALNFGLMIRI